MNHLAQPVVCLSVFCVLLCTLEVVSGLGPAVFKHPAALHSRAEGGQLLGTCTLDQVKALFLDYPDECSGALQDISKSFADGSATVGKITQLYQIACEGKCIDPIKEFGTICEAEKTVELVLSSCNKDSLSDDVCVVSLLKNDGLTAARECDRAVNAQKCSDECRNSLQELKEDLDCCVNSLFNVTTYGFDTLNVADYKLWSLCGVTTPPFCNANSELFGSNSVIPSASFFTILVLLITLYIL